MENKIKEGWTFLYNSRKWHYFRGNNSLCGRYMLFRLPDDMEKDDNFGSPDNCKACERKRLKEIGQEATNGK